MREIHERIAAIGLREAEEYGFVLAGGYAISANGMGDRPSMDVDLFTNQFDPGRFAEAVTQVRNALVAVAYSGHLEVVGLAQVASEVLVDVVQLCHGNARRFDCDDVSLSAHRRDGHAEDAGWP